MSVGSYFVLVLIIPVAISMGELALGKLFSLTLTSVVATRKQIPLAFTRLVVFKLGIWISLIVLFACAAFLVMTVDVSDRSAFRYVYRIVPLFIIPPIVFFSLQFSTWVRFERRRARESRASSLREGALSRGGAGKGRGMRLRWSSRRPL